MNLASGDELYISGFSDRMETVSIAKTMISEDHGLGPTGKADTIGSLSPSRKSSPSGSNSRGTNNNGDDVIEVDFYRNPTMLSRMILYNKFANANKRVRDHPIEARVWVCAKRKTNATQKSQIHSIFDRPLASTNLRTEHQDSSNSGSSADSDYSLRQLPIHIACTSLAFAHDSVLRSELEQLIVRLVVTYPEGCAEFDHSGRRPLHEAIWSAASDETISMLLMASPKSIEQRDKFGRTPIELCNRLQDERKEDIKSLLDLGVQYWERARDEAKLRMKLAVVPPSGASVGSSIVVGSSQAEKETINTSESAKANLPTKKQQQNEIQSEEITPIAWEQLERRVILLEQLLAEMYEKNYELAGAVEQLKMAKQALTVKLEIARTQPTSSLRSARGTLHSRGGGSTKSGSRSIETLSVDTIPEDDEESTIADMIDQVESLVGSYHSSRRYQPTAVSELSSFSSHTGPGDSAIPLPPDFGRSESLVSGLTDASCFDATIYAVRDAGYSPSTAGTDSRFGPSLLGTDNLNEIFEVAQQTARRAWSSPMASSKNLQQQQQSTTTPMVVEEEEEGSGLGNVAMDVDNDNNNNNPTGEIYFPGFQVPDPAPAHVNSSLSMTASSIESSAIRIPENSTVGDDDDDETSHTGRVSPATGDEVSRETMSTRARIIEDKVFGGGEDFDNNASESSSSSAEPGRYNYDIRIPALDWA